ncbi:prealbumin-like fold domain-containing protein, partial [Tahibacter aquaticus]|uniref:prealbumin-like fold domain-containing protein n=1 Tax=Tahibacter aquaticus TaxID=520092 RepID=UPI001FB5C6AF
MALALMMAALPSQAAQVQHLTTQSAAASGAGAAGKPTIASFSIPSGKNRALFIWATFERDHCSPADTTAGRCASGNTAGTGLGDNWPEPRTGTPPATTTNSQITAQFVGPGGTINKQNALVIGGTPSGDTRFITISTSPTGSPAGTAFFGVSSFHIVLFENEINTLLGGTASGSIAVTFPDVTVPSGAGDDALVTASVFQNVEQTVTGFVRNATATAQVTTGTPGNFAMAPAAYDAGQAPDEADDGKLVTAANSSTEGFVLPAGHVALATLSVTNNLGEYDTPNGNINNEPNGLTGAAYFRNGGATPASLYTVQAAGAAGTLVYGGTNASFLLESDNADVGDAPVAYGNPTHTISGVRLGASVDADASLLNNATATGDDTNNTDDEDGVTLTPLLPIGQTTIVPVSIQNASGFLSAWFDWNVDGDFNDAGEQMVNAQAVAPGTVNLNITVPLGAVIGPTFARFRVCTNNTALDNCNTPAGTVQSGEVEDYQFQVSRLLQLFKTTVGGAGGPFTFALTNTGQVTGTVTTATAATPTAVDGDTGIAGTQGYAIVSPTSAVSITEGALPVGWSLTGASCENAASTPVGSLSGTTYTISGAEIAASISFSCTFTNTKLPILRLQKTLPTGRFAAGDQFTLTIAGTGGPAAVTTTGAGTTATGLATLNNGVVGANYVLSEAAAGGANLANYQTSYSCTNALSGGQTPSGSGTSFNVTANAGDDLTCTFSNSGAPQLTLSKTASASPWTVGVPASYTLQVTNTGTTATTAAATITDTIPTGLTIGTLPAGCTAAGQTVTCTVPAGLAASASTSFVIPVTPTLAAGTSVTNTATVSGGGDSGCPAAARCSSTAGPTAIGAPQLTLSKTASASPWTVGVPASYTLQVTNTGTTATTAAATITDTIPTGLTIGTLPAGCTAAGQTVTCTVPAGLAATASTSFVIPVTPTLAAGTSVTNTATVSGGGDSGCPAAARCSSSAGPTTIGAPQLTLSKTASASPWTVGVPASYTLQVTNTGTTATTAAATIT